VCTYEFIRVYVCTWVDETARMFVYVCVCVRVCMFECVVVGMCVGVLDRERHIQRQTETDRLG